MEGLGKAEKRINKSIKELKKSGKSSKEKLKDVELLVDLRQLLEELLSILAMTLAQSPMKALSLEEKDMLCKVVTNYLTVSAWTEARHLTGFWNRWEAATSARFIDCLIKLLGFMRSKNELAVKLALRSLAVVTMGDKAGNWEATRELEEEQENFISELVNRKLHKSAKLCNEFRKDKYVVPKQGDGNQN
ncbi:unnamed protein product [Agarophyton chilense]